MTLSQRFKSLPTGTQRLLGLAIVMAMFIALPLFIWAIVTQSFNLKNKAASGEPGVCVITNNTIIVSPSSETNGTCHDIQTAINNTIENTTVLIRPGTYNIASTLDINTKNNIKITGDHLNGDAKIVFNSNGWGFKVFNSSGSIQWIKATGRTDNGLLSIQNSTNFSVENANLFATSSHTLDVQNSSQIVISDCDVQSFAGAIEFNGSHNISVLHSKIHNSVNGISVSNSSYLSMSENSIYRNRQSGLRLDNDVQSVQVGNNTFADNGLDGSQFATIMVSGITNPNPVLQFFRNVITTGKGPGVQVVGGNGITYFQYNDVFDNHPNYKGYANQTGLNGNISANPQLTNSFDLYCPAPTSPVLYGNISTGNFMGYISSCPNGVSPPPTASPSPSPVPTCRPRPHCLDTNPQCYIPEPLEGWCAKPSPTASPTMSPTASPTASPTVIAGDVNGDGIVNIVDIGIIISNYGLSPIPNPKADLNVSRRGTFLTG